MKFHQIRLILAILTIFFLSLRVIIASPGTGSPASDQPAGYQLIWSDDFSHDPPGLPDPAKWSYEKGYVRNHEAQYYTEGRTENARVEQGKLIIEARKDSYLIPNGSGKIARYTSASITTDGKASWLYGRIVIRAKMPIGKGVWPALWTLGTNIHTINWPKCGEIDLVEMFKEPHLIRGNFHYSKLGKHVSSDGGSYIVSDSDTQFHNYVLDWTDQGITLSVEGYTYAHLDTSKASDNGINPFKLPQYLIMNLALGGNAGGQIDDSIFPQRMEVEWVRVYQKKAQ